MMQFSTSNNPVTVGELRQLVQELDRFEIPDDRVLYGETQIAFKTPPPIKKLVVK